jgi:hypothetical protein
MSRLVILLCVGVVASSFDVDAQTKTEPPKQPTVDKKKLLAGPVPGYKHRSIEGFDVFLSSKVLEHADDADYKRKPLDVLELELNTITRSLPPNTVRLLRGIVIWVEWDDTQNPHYDSAIAVYYGVMGNVALWSLQKGAPPGKANNVEIISLKKLTGEHQPDVKFERCVILHELSHAVHSQLFGPNNATIKAAYKQAMDRKLYDEAEDVYGRRMKPAYAATNDHEYFAELSCAYLNKLHYFPTAGNQKKHEPFTAPDLKKHDPTGYKMMEATWGTHKQIDAGVKIENEKAATRRLDKAKGLQQSKKTEEALAALGRLIEYYPTSKAATEAKTLQEKWNK